jgi:glycosyltransferase 2 family protein
MASKQTHAPKASRSVIAAACTLVITTYLASLGMRSLERELFLLVYDWPPVVTPFFVVITYLGTVWAALGMSLGVLVVRKKLFATLIVSGISAYLLVEGAKQAIARPRPFSLLDGVVSRDPTAYGFGFPSGHVALATTLVLIAHRLWPTVSKWWWVSFVALVALSRVHLGVHAPLDILGGAALAVLVFYATELVLAGPKKPVK